jgi:hypothetical protein
VKRTISETKWGILIGDNTSGHYQKKYTVPTIHRNKVGIVKFDILHTNKHDRSWLSRSISIKSAKKFRQYNTYVKLDIERNIVKKNK